MEKSAEQKRKQSGNRALGFVLIAMGAFALAVGSLLFFLFWPVGLAGAGSLAAGAALYQLDSA